MIFYCRSLIFVAIQANKVGVHEVDVLWNKCFNDLSRSFTVCIELDVNISLTSAGVAEEFQTLL